MHTSQPPVIRRILATNGDPVLLRPPVRALHGVLVDEANKAMRLDDDAGDLMGDLA